MIKPKSLPAVENLQTVSRALLSVSDKTDLIPFAQRLAQCGIEIISTGGTARTLREAGLQVKDVSEITGFPEIMDGRVKTLHPNIHGSLLARRNNPDDLVQLRGIGSELIDLVVVNLYPFQKAISQEAITDALAIENMDIGGPTMIRAAAKNFFFVTVVTSSKDYDTVAQMLEENHNTLPLEFRRQMATKAFEHTAAYDTAIAQYFIKSHPKTEDTIFERPLQVNLPLVQALRYGENPHQRAAFFGHPDRYFRKLHGKELSYNNLLDLSAALFLIDEFKDARPTAAILKHTNPCGVGTANVLSAAYKKAFSTDRQSPFGGIVAVNRPLDLATAQAIDQIFTEMVIAPSFDEEALALLSKKQNRRIIQMNQAARFDHAPDIRSVIGGMLVQSRDSVLRSIEDAKKHYVVVTDRQPTNAEWLDLDFAWRIAKHVKSNAIVYAKNGMTLGIGAGQMSRIDASEVAVMKGQKEALDFTGCVVASDAFFPFADGLLAAANAGATAAIQPGGSIRDEEVIEAANQQNLAMVFTAKRHFRH